MKHRIVLLLLIAVAAVSGYLFGLRHQTRRGLTTLETVLNPALETVEAQSAPERPMRVQVCTAALLQGAYALNAGGSLPASSSGEYATVGLINFDGSGALALRSTQSFNGRIVPPINILGAYGINPDCTGRISLVTGSVFDIVVADGGREINLIQINNDSVLRGVAKKL